MRRWVDSFKRSVTDPTSEIAPMASPPAMIQASVLTSFSPAFRPGPARRARPTREVSPWTTGLVIPIMNICSE